MTRAKRIARLAVLLAPLSLAGCDECPICNAQMAAWYQQIAAAEQQQILAQYTVQQTPASTLSRDTTDLSTDPWWGGSTTASPAAPSN